MSDVTKSDPSSLVVRRDMVPDKEPRVHDLDLAKRLGFASPYDIRKTIKRHLDAGNLGAPGTVAMVARGEKRGSRATTEYWLDEASALFIASQSGTEKAIAITKEVIAVFIAARRGQIRASHPLLADDLVPWDVMFGPSLIEALCKLYGHPHGGRTPAWLASIWKKLYELIGDRDCYAEMKARNPEPRQGSNHHQFLNDEARPRFRMHLSAVEQIARASMNPEEFWHRMEAAYQRMPMQLPLSGVPRPEAA